MCGFIFSPRVIALACSRSRSQDARQRLYRIDSDVDMESQVSGEGGGVGGHQPAQYKELRERVDALSGRIGRIEAQVCLYLCLCLCLCFVSVWFVCVCGVCVCVCVFARAYTHAWARLFLTSSQIHDECAYTGCTGVLMLL